MSAPFVTRRVQWMDMQPTPNGMMPTLWDTDDRRDGTPRVRVGVEVHHDCDGKPEHFVVSSDDNHVMFCEQEPGPEPLCEAE